MQKPAAGRVQAGFAAKTKAYEITKKRAVWHEWVFQGLPISTMVLLPNCGGSQTIPAVTATQSMPVPENLRNVRYCEVMSRRIGVYQAERMMTNNRIYSAPELFEMGVIDEICRTGEGIRTVERFVIAHAKRRAARLALQRSRYRLAPLDYQELSIAVDERVETARHLSAEELRTMDMLIMMQQGLKQNVAAE